LEKDGLRINTFYGVPIDEIENKIKVIVMPQSLQFTGNDKFREKQHQEKEELRQYIHEILKPEN
jgi:hypothetical protein